MIKVGHMLNFREPGSCFMLNQPLESGQALIDVRHFFFSSPQSEELDNLIKMNKSLKR